MDSVASLQNDCCGNCHRKPYCRLAPVQKSYSPAAWNGARLDGAILFTCGWICREPIKNLSRDCFGFRSSNDIQYTTLQRCSGTLLTAGIAGLIATFIVADKLTNIVPIRIAKGILRNISRNALVVLAVHWWILLVLRIIFKSELDKPETAFLSTLIVTVGITITIPNKPYHPRPTCD